MHKHHEYQSKEASEALDLLIEDHRSIQKLFRDFDKIKDQDDDDRKQNLVRTICTELNIHAQIEEEIFYPAVRDALGEDDIFDEAEVEHASAAEMVAQLEAMEPYDELYNARVRVLGAYIGHHIKEEQEKIFRKVKVAGLDMQSLSDELSARKQELQAELGVGQAADRYNSRMDRQAQHL